MNKLLCEIVICIATITLVWSCTPFADSDCANKDVDFVADPCDTGCFYTCELHGQSHVGVKRCCNRCEDWSQNLLTCVYQDYNPGCDYRPTTDVPIFQEECQLHAGPNPYTFVTNGTEMNCAVGTSFNSTLCACQEDAFNPLKMDSLITCVTFDDGWNGLQGRNGVYVHSNNVEVVANCSDQGSNCGYFNSTAESSMDIPMFANAMDAYQGFSLSFFMKRDYGVHGEKGLVNNGDCGLESSFDVLSLDNSIYFSVRNASDSVVNSGQLQNADGAFVHIAIVYDSNSVTIYQSGSVVSVQPFQGRIKRVYNPMVIGGTLCQSEGKYFQGYLDTISFLKVALTPEQVRDLADNRQKCLPTV